MIFARFNGRPPHRPRAAALHLWLANFGLAGMVSGFILRVYRRTPGQMLLAAGGVLSVAGAFLFIYNIWRTLERPRARPAALPTR